MKFNPRNPHKKFAEVIFSLVKIPLTSANIIYPIGFVLDLHAQTHGFQDKKKAPTPKLLCLQNWYFVSAPPGARTLDTLIKSQVLYQLS